jgi:hypothetical protein
MQNPPNIEARYANYFQTGQNAIELVVEFGQLYADDTAPLLHTRIITTPAYAKNLLKLLQEALALHEQQFGPVRET